MTEEKGRSKTGSPQVNLVLSLPSGEEGIRIKEALRKLASDNHRSVSNQTTIILRSYLESEKKL